MANWTVKLGGAALRRSKTPRTALAITVRELGRCGVPARKAPRVLEELQHMADADETLNRPAVLAGLARELARFYL